MAKAEEGMAAVDNGRQTAWRHEERDSFPACAVQWLCFHFLSSSGWLMIGLAGDQEFEYP